MKTTERRLELIRIMCNRRYEKTENLAFEFNVSEKTVRRDIDAVSTTVPLYTKRGAYGGGVYLLGDYAAEKTYMSDSEILFLKRLSERCRSGTDRRSLQNIIKKYGKNFNTELPRPV